MHRQGRLSRDIKIEWQAQTPSDLLPKEHIHWEGRKLARMSDSERPMLRRIRILLRR